MSITAKTDTILPTWLRAMLDPAFHGETVKEVKLIQTHISWVVLTGIYAYKIKKPVNFGFLDFSSLEKRRKMCRRELELNRRLAPDLYIDVLPICKSHGQFSIGSQSSDATVVEFCLKMVQFDPDALLAKEIEDKNFDPKLMDELAHMVALFHLSAQPIHDHRFGNISILRRYMSENIQAALELSHLRETPDFYPSLKFGCDQILQKLEPLIEKRSENGYIRTCHGDMHLGNIAIVNRSPCVFDCIEFNDELINIDTMNDLSFVTMDCDARHHSELGLRFLSRYLEYTGDYSGLALLRLYQTYRAGVRGKVAMLVSNDASITVQSANEKRQEACHYFNLAASYCNADDQPRMFVVGGVSGSGKSHLALLGSQAEQAVIIRSDATRKRLALNSSAPVYSPSMTKRTYEELMLCADLTLAAGYSVILDATFLDREYRDKVRGLAKKRAVPLHMLWLDLPASELRRRIASRNMTGSDISDANLAVLESQLSRYQRPIESDIYYLSNSDTWPDYITSTA